MKSIKIIQINSCSSSFSTYEVEKDIFRAWYAKVAFNLKKYFPKLEVECWTIERFYKKPKIKIFKNIKFRIFPTNLSVRHSMEISMQIVKALNKEIKKARKEYKKLVLHFHEYHSWIVYLVLLLIKKQKNIKIIAQHHGGRSPLENLKNKRFLFLFLPFILVMQFCENIILKKIDSFYALSNEEIKYLRSFVSGDKIRFQTMGIDEEYFKLIDKKTAKKKLNLDLDKKYIFYLGRIKSTKGIGELLDALKELRRENIELLIIGQGPDTNKYKRYAEKRKIENFKFLGTKYGEEKLLYFSACDCLILPSYTEGAPVVLMEAIAKNLPVIVTNVGGVSRMMENGREGIIIKPKSTKEIVRAIREILKWKEKNIQKYAEKYKWEKIIKKTYEDYIR